MATEFPFPGSPTVDLIPFDPDSEEHAQRLYDQRIACGWLASAVPSLRDLQREGGKGLHWIALPSDFPNREDLISKHLSRYPEESTPLKDSAINLFGKPRDISEKVIGSGNNDKGDGTFIPIGHISIDDETACPGYANTSENTYAITLFYISHALQRSGIGSKAMTAVEQLALKKFNAKFLALATPLRSDFWNEERDKAMGRVKLKVVTQDWYEKRGYCVYEVKEEYIVDVDEMGRKWPWTFVYMRKGLAELGEGEVRKEVPVVPTPAI